MQKIRTLVFGLLVAAGAVSTIALTAPSVSAVNVWKDACENQSSQVCGASSGDSAQNMMKNIINTILLVLGMIAVIMIVIGGIRYALSGGDASSTKAAKDTILYAVVGLVVAIMAYAIVEFVVGRFTGGGGGGGGGTNQQQTPGQNGTPAAPTPPSGATINPNEE